MNYTTSITITQPPLVPTGNGLQRIAVEMQVLRLG